MRFICCGGVRAGGLINSPQKGSGVDKRMLTGCVGQPETNGTGFLVRSRTQNRRSIGATFRKTWPLGEWAPCCCCCWCRWEGGFSANGRKHLHGVAKHCEADGSNYTNGLR